jgi:phage shock protein A
MDLKNFAVSFASAEKMIGSGFVQLADNVQSVNRQIKELDQKYEELRAEIEALKAIKPQVVKETVVTEVVVKENSQP